MIINELILHNFGVYAGRQKIILSPTSPNKPVILFGGLNGGGKTTLLDAIQLVFFGPRANVSNRNGSRYQDYLKSCVNNLARQKEASVQISFRHIIEGVENEYRLHRSWQVTPTGCKEHFEVIRNGKLDEAVTDNWLNQVEDFFPEKIAHLFLFDGEKIESYADPDKSASLVGTAIQNLLGLDVVDRLNKDLQILERRKQTEQGSESFNAEIMLAEIELSEIRTKILKIKHEKSSLANQLDRKRNELSIAEEQFKKLGGELYARRHDLEQEKDATEKALERKKSELVELAAGPLPLNLVADQLEAVATRVAIEENSQSTKHVLDVLSARDEELLNLLKGQKVGKKIQLAVANFLHNDRAKRVSKEQLDPVLEMPSDARADLHALRTKELKALLGQATVLLEQKVKLEDDVERLHLEYASIPSNDTIDPLIEKRSRLSVELKRLEKEFDVRAAEIERLERELNRQKQKLANLLERDIEVTVRSEDQKRILIHSSRVRHTMAKFRQVIIDYHVHRIEELVLESFLLLLRKSNLVSNLKIDPKTFQINLFDLEQRRVPQGKLSAGERQLLAVSLLWGLAKASGRPLPTAIDTPLGRLDATHRSNLVERYFPYASHQVILLSTDEEIDKRYLKKLKPWIGRTYHLAFNEDKSATEVKTGYFYQL